MFDLDMFFIIYNCKDLGTSFFSLNPLAFTKKCCTFANGTNIINMEKDNLSFPPLMSGLNICFSIFLMSSSLIIVF